MSLPKAKQSCLFLMRYAKSFYILYNKVSSWWDLQKCFIFDELHFGFTTNHQPVSCVEEQTGNKIKE